MAPSPEGEENHTTLLLCANAHSCLPSSLHPCQQPPPPAVALPASRSLWDQGTGVTVSTPPASRGFWTVLVHQARALEKTADGLFVLELEEQGWPRLGLSSPTWLCHQLASLTEAPVTPCSVMKGLSISHPSWPHLSPSPPTTKVEPVRLPPCPSFLFPLSLYHYPPLLV